MVSFNNAGRFGNWFLECATMISYALKHNLDFTVPATTNNQYHNPIYCLHLVNSNYNPSLEKINLWENGHGYKELPFEESWREKNIIIEGYRQSEKYFKEHRSEILYLLDFPYQKREGYVGVHVRRGDYLVLREKHPEVTKEWYENAMRMFTGFKFKFYSDEIGWCINEFGGRSDCEFSQGNDIVFDAYDGACCQHNVISASTFGWTQAWLNRNLEKKIVLPKLWFTPNWDNLDVKDIVPEEWVRT